MKMKLDALKRLDKGESVNKITMDLGVGRTTLIGWKKKRSEIKSWCARAWIYCWCWQAVKRLWGKPVLLTRKMLQYLKIIFTS
ncbi:hypothetical protein X975_16229, partial [Stegodyphus mimosarum]